MKKMVLVAAVIAAAVVATSVTPPMQADAATIDAADFLKTNGTVLKKNSGTGTTVNLRGTNVGGWLTQEDWMSPLGEFAADRTGWTATASSGAPAGALDGSASTRWTTGANQTGAEWLQLDLGANTLFSRLSVDNTNFAGTYPRNVEVKTSTDGITWASVANQPGVAGVTTAKFSPQVARYVRLGQTGAATALWSVGEINLFNDPVLFNGTHTATASSTAGGTLPGMALDGNAMTAWQSGSPQAPGQSYTIDLGRNTDMDKVLFDSGAAAPNDFPRTWDVFTSYDNVNFVKAASGYGTNRVILADFQGGKSGRYLKIESNGTSAQWWSIAEIAISSGNNLDRGGWIVSASTGATPANVKDNDVATRWTTGVPQAGGQSLTVDMGALITLNNVTTDTAKNTSNEQDYPRGYQVQLSKNGTTWTTVATGVGTVKASTIPFPAQATRYFRINQTATSTAWWSIGELTAGLYNDDYSLNNTLATRFGAAGAQTIINKHQDTWLATADLDNMQAAGMNFIRVPIGWNTFLNLDGTWKADPWTKIDWIISEAAARGIYVLVDLHTVPGGGCPWGSCGRIGPNPNGFWGSATYQNWTEDIWKAIATRYVGNPAVAGYDLINEPLIDYGEDADDVTQKSAYYDRLYDAVRAIDPNHVIYLGAFFGSGNLAAPSVYGWTNVVYEFHPYDMPNSKDWTAQNQLVTSELAGLPAKLTSLGVPILYGEYSLYYNDDVWARFMAGLNANSVSWSNWAYKVKGSQTDGFAYWGLYYNNQNPVPIINSDDSATFVAKLGRFGTANFTKNTALVSTVQKYATAGLATYAPVAVSQTGWVATASSTAAGTTAAGGIDGASATAWSSGQAMTGSEWFKIDMGSPRTVAMVTVQTPSTSTWDYPRGFSLDVSTNGTTWVNVSTGIAYGWKRPISITPTTARYIRITQTGVAPQWWTVDDVTVYSSY